MPIYSRDDILKLGDLAWNRSQATRQDGTCTFCKKPLRKGTPNYSAGYQKIHEACFHEIMGSVYPLGEAILDLCKDVGEVSISRGIVTVRMPNGGYWDFTEPMRHE